MDRTDNHTTVVRFRNELLLLSIIVILFIIIISLFPSNVLRIILGLPLTVFFPGYTLTAAIFPRKDTLGNIERVALSFGLSFVIVPLTGLILNYTPWGFRLYSVLTFLSVIILSTSLLAWYRRRRLAEPERFTITFNLTLPSWKDKSTVNKVLVIILAVVILGTIGTFAYVIIAPRVGETFTEFYILGSEGNAQDYPVALTVGEEARLSIAIINHEHEDITYYVEITIDGKRNNMIGPIVLSHEGKWQEEVGFTADKLGRGQKVEFILYRGGDSFSRLYLWIDVVR